MRSKYFDHTLTPTCFIAEQEDEDIVCATRNSRFACARQFGPNLL